MTGKLGTLLDYEGYDSVDDFVSDYCDEPACPGICLNDGCDHVVSVVADSLGEWCEVCSAKTVRSGLVLAGEE